ncbi:MAG: hypothetical protein FGM33_00885 [Candidatus Kapabacteria bacterium]|nr:hypothetical protein [Candidatus Kapabacteria bacterium]
MGPLFIALYRGLITPMLAAGLAVLAPFHKKLSRRRRDEASSLDAARKHLATDPRPRVWFHAASMGELEQLLPMIEDLRQAASEVCIVTTCTSPSGRDHASRQSAIDHALYLPIDRYGAMRDFIDTVNPRLVIIDRYDLWPTMISLLRRRGVTMRLVNATMPSAARLPLLQGFIKRLYAMVDSITAVTHEDALELSTLLNRPIEWLPDTRLDRVERKRQTLQHDASILPDWIGHTLVLGSSWPHDESLILDAWKRVRMQDWRLVIVPHEPTEAALVAIEERVPCRRLSTITDSAQASEVCHIVVDSVGKLLHVYASADAAYVGGGFGAGVHSLAEPAGYGMPIACGPGIERSRDAAGLAQHTAITIITTVDDARRWLEDVGNDEFRRQARQNCRAYVELNTGSTKVHMRWLLDELRRQGIIG